MAFMGVGVSRIPRDGDDYADDPQSGALETSSPDPFAGQPDPYGDPDSWRTWAMAQPLEWKLDTLDPRLRQPVETMLTGLRGAGFTSATINYGWRHPAIQASLMRDGYTQTPWSLHSAVVYNTELQAWVAAALATDIYWPGAANDAERARFYRNLQAMAVSLGLVSGANWWGNGPARAKARWAAYGLGYDPPHVELAISAEEKAVTRQAILGGIQQLAEPEEPVWAIPGGDVLAAYPVSWFRRTETVQQIVRAVREEATQQVKDNKGTIALVVGVGAALALIAANWRGSK